MKRLDVLIVVAALFIAAPSYALPPQNPVQKIIKKIRAFFRPNPFAVQRRQIQKDYDDDKISKDEYENRLDDVDRQEEAYKEMQQQAMEQCRQAAAQQASQ